MTKECCKNQAIMFKNIRSKYDSEGNLIEQEADAYCTNCGEYLGLNELSF